MTPEQIESGLKACASMQAGLPKLVEACEEWAEEIERTRVEGAASLAEAREGAGEHTDARLVETAEALEACCRQQASFAKTLRTLAKGQRTLAKYLGLLLEPPAVPKSKPFVATPGGGEPVDSTDSDPVNPPPPAPSSQPEPQFRFDEGGA